MFFFVLCWSAATATDATVAPAIDQLVREGHWKQARTALGQGDASPHNEYLRARVAYAFGDYKTALPLAQRALAANENDANAHLLFGQVNGQLATKAHFTRQITLVHIVKREFENAYAIDPRNIEVIAALVEFHLRAPGIVGGDKKKARVLAEEALKVNAARSYVLQAMVARKFQETSRLSQLYAKAVEAEPDYPALIAAGNYFLSAQPQESEAAANCARRAIALDPSRGQAYGLLAEALARAKRWAELEQIFAQMERSAVDDLSAYYRAATALIARGEQPDRAENYLRRYLRQEPEAGAPSLADAHAALGLLFSRSGRRSEGIGELREALRLDPACESAAKALKTLQ